MMKHLLTTLIVSILATTSYAQLTGTRTIPGSYPSIAAALTDVNGQGVGAGGIIFNIAAGYSETAPAGGLLLTASGSAANPITFQKSGTGSNPKITSTDAGTIATSVFGAQGDAVLIVQGSDFITFNGIDISATSAGIEYGYYLRKVSGTNGCKNVTIENAAVTLTKGSSPFITGIYASNNSSTSSATSAAGIGVTSTGGINENIAFTGNTISNVATGIALIGYNAPAPYTFYDQNYTIGTSEQGNNIQNFGGHTTANCSGIYTLYVKSANISSNNIANSAGNGAAATGTLYGILFDTNSSLLGDYVANNNTFNLSQGSTAALSFIHNVSSVTNFTANNNKFSAGTFASTVNSYFIYATCTTTATNMNNNQTVGSINKTGEGNFAGIWHTGFIANGGTTTASGNDFSNITINGYFTFHGIMLVSITSENKVATNNRITNITGNGTRMITGIEIDYGFENKILANYVNALAGAYTIVGISKVFSGAPMSQNTVSNLTALDVVYGIYYQSASCDIYNNKIFNLTASSITGEVSGIYIGNNGGSNYVYNVYNNYIGNLNTPAVNSLSDVIRGLNLQSFGTTGTNFNISFNTVFLNASTTGGNLSTSAIYHVANANPSMDVLNLVNNILVNTSVAKGAGTSAVIRRSGVTLNNYGQTSNNNLLYAGLPSANSLIYDDGLSKIQTLAEFKAMVSPRESASITENPPFVSTMGAAPEYLHIKSGTNTQIDNGGKPVAGITTDFDGDIRNSTTPDIGADEFFNALPITFEYLRGQKSGNTNSIAWKVNCTSTSITMELERSTNGRTFDKLLSRITATQARCGQPFDAIDASPASGINYYRLKMIDVDGRTTYSPVAKLQNSKENVELASIFPTLVTTHTFLSVSSGQEETIQFNITDLSGKVVRSFIQPVGNGSSSIRINTADLPAGVYNVSGILNGVRTQTLRFVKQ